MSKEELQAALLKTKDELLKSQNEKKNEKKTGYVYGTTNPLTFPPSEYSKEIFLINQPLIDQVKSSRVNTLRKCEMDKEALAYAINKMLFYRTLIDLSVCKTRKNEMTLNHQSFLSGCWYLTSPSPHFVEKCRRLGIAKLFGQEEESEEEEELVLPVPYVVPEDCGSESHAGLTLATVLDECVLNAQSFVPESDTEAAEEPVESESVSVNSMDGTPEAGRKDLSVKVWVQELNDWISVLCIEGKEPLTVNGMYQALAYACREGMINADKGRVGPIYVQQWSRSHWQYGILDIYGYVTVEEGQVTDASYQKFCDQQYLRWKLLGNDPTKFSVKFPKVKLEESLLSRQRWMRAKCKSHPTISYPNKEYLVALAFVDVLPYSLPDVDQNDGATMPHAQLFYESLLKIIIGPKVVNWTKEDVDQALATRLGFVSEWADVISPSKRQRVQ